MYCLTPCTAYLDQADLLWPDHTPVQFTLSQSHLFLHFTPGLSPSLLSKLTPLTDSSLCGLGMQRLCLLWQQATTGGLHLAAHAQVTFEEGRGAHEDCGAIRVKLEEGWRLVGHALGQGTWR